MKDSSESNAVRPGSHPQPNATDDVSFHSFCEVEIHGVRAFENAYDKMRLNGYLVITTLIGSPMPPSTICNPLFTSSSRTLCVTERERSSFPDWTS